MLNNTCTDILININNFLSNSDKLKYEIALKNKDNFTYIYNLSLTESNKLTDEILSNNKFKYLESIWISNDKIKNLTNFKNLKYIVLSNFKMEYSDNFEKLQIKYFGNFEFVILINKKYPFTNINKQLLIINILCKYYRINLKLNNLIYDPNFTDFKVIFPTKSGKIIHNTSKYLMLKLSKYVEAFSNFVNYGCHDSYGSCISCSCNSYSSCNICFETINLDYIEAIDEKYIEYFTDLLYFGKLNYLLTCKNEKLLHFLSEISDRYLFIEVKEICRQIEILYKLI